MRILLALVFFGCVVSCFAAGDEADIVYLKNGGSVKGIISKEGASNVEIETSAGMITIGRPQIQSIHHAPPEALDELRDQWKHRQATLKRREKISAEERDKRFKAYGEWTREEARLKAEANREEGEVRIARDPDTKSVLVDVLLNGDVKATLILDTGASIVVLPKRFGDKLGIDTTTTEGKDVIELHLAGGKVVKARMFALKSLNVQGIDEKDVTAAVILEDAEHLGSKDGLLGRSFLNKFNIKIDAEKMLMTLEKIK
jgi:clan AA aspartic protease (TIGR02281 family)